MRVKAYSKYTDLKMHVEEKTKIVYIKIHSIVTTIEKYESNLCTSDFTINRQSKTIWYP